MEELGIGRPSTYASIVTTIQDREYVRKDKNRLIPEDKGRLVTAFLVNYFRKYVGYDFTADLEDQLDDVSAGDARLQGRAGAVLARFLRRHRRNRGTAHHRGAGKDQRGAGAASVSRQPKTAAIRASARTAALGGCRMRTARSGGAFIGCSNYPECRYTRPFGPPGEEDDERRSRRKASCWARTRATRSRCARAGLVPTCSAAR